MPVSIAIQTLRWLHPISHWFAMRRLSRSIAARLAATPRRLTRRSQNRDRRAPQMGRRKWAEMSPSRPPILTPGGVASFVDRSCSMLLFPCSLVRNTSLTLVFSILTAVISTVGYCDHPREPSDRWPPRAGCNDYPGCRGRRGYSALQPARAERSNYSRPPNQPLGKSSRRSGRSDHAP